MALKLNAEIGLDGSGFERGIKSLGASAGGLLKSRLGALFSLAAMTEFGRRLVANASQIKDLAEQYSVTTTEQQRLDLAAQQNGLSFGDVGAALIRLGKARRDAAEGNEELAAIFAKFGVTLADLNNPAKRNVDLLNQIGAAITNMNLTAADRTELSDMLGKVGEKLEVVLRDAQQLSDVNFISDEQLRRIDHMEKVMDRAGLHLRNFSTVAIGGVLEKVEIISKLIAGLGIGKAAGLSNYWSAVLSRTLVGADLASQREAEARNSQPPSGGGELFKPKGKSLTGRPAQIREPQPVSDALSSVGNFLGQSGPLVSVIAEQQLDIARQSLDQHKATNAKLDRLNERIGNLEGGLDIGE